MESNNKFKQTLINNSTYKNFNVAIKEWEVLVGYRNKTNCICGQPIINVCVVKNKFNNIILHIGSECINKFTDEDWGWFFKGLDRLKNNKIPQEEFINYCNNKFIITEFEFKFLKNLFGKKKFTQKQINYKYVLINKLKTIFRF